eukprot:Sspe_Gene.81214::Locus_51823_Transcript_2_4_Confidence_0.148_Length_412::g.81214::m.81214
MGLWGNEEDDSILDRKIPRSVHITKILKQHPYHPYNPDMKEGHPCEAINSEFFKCMEDLGPDMELHQKHVNCFLIKTELMKCLVKDKKQGRVAQAAAASS